MQVYIELATLLIKIHLTTRMRNLTHGTKRRAKYSDYLIRLQERCLKALETVFTDLEIDLDLTACKVNGYKYDPTQEPEQVALVLKEMHGDAMIIKEPIPFELADENIEDAFEPTTREEIDHYNSVRIARMNRNNLESTDHVFDSIPDDEAEAMMQEIEESRGIDRKRPRTMHERFPPAKKQCIEFICID